MENQYPNDQFISIYLIHYPLYTLGPGERIGIWLQGCSIRCKGCLSSLSWRFDEKYQRSIDGIIQYFQEILSNKKSKIGLTVSGGEPFDQPKSLFTMLLACSKIDIHDILVYSGYNYNYLKTKYDNILKYIDALVDGSFIKGKNTNYIWKGSENQRLYILSQKIEIRNIYEDYIKKAELQRTLQVIPYGKSIHILGIPEQSVLTGVK